MISKYLDYFLFTTTGFHWAVGMLFIIIPILFRYLKGTWVDNLEWSDQDDIVNLFFFSFIGSVLYFTLWPILLPIFLSVGFFYYYSTIVNTGYDMFIEMMKKKPVNDVRSRELVSALIEAEKEGDVDKISLIVDELEKINV